MGATTMDPIATGNRFGPRSHSEVRWPSTGALASSPRSSPSSESLSLGVCRADPLINSHPLTAPHRPGVRAPVSGVPEIPGTTDTGRWGFRRPIVFSVLAGDLDERTGLERLQVVGLKS